MFGSRFVSPWQPILLQVYERRLSRAGCPGRLFDGNPPCPVAGSLVVVGAMLPAGRVQADRVSSPISTADDTGAEACAVCGGRRRVYPVRLSGNILLSTVGRAPQTCQPYYSTKTNIRLHYEDFGGGGVEVRSESVACGSVGVWRCGSVEGRDAGAGRSHLIAAGAGIQRRRAHTPA